MISVERLQLFAALFLFHALAMTGHAADPEPLAGTKPLTVKVQAFSESAKEKILAAGGKVETIK